MPWPASMTTIEVTGTVLKYPEGAPASGNVTFTNAQWLRSPSSNAFIEPFTATATLDGTGYFAIELPATDDPEWSPLGWQYAVQINTDGRQLNGSLDLPYNGPVTIDLTDVLAVGTPASGENYMPRSLRGAPGGVASLDESGYVPLEELPLLPTSAVAGLEEMLANSQAVQRPGAMRTGSRYAPVALGFAPSSIALNELRHVPIDFYSACTITELAVEVTTAVPNAMVRIVVSASDANGRPSGAHLYASPQLVASAVGKVGTGAISVSIPGPGRYFFAALPQVAVPPMRSIAMVPAMFEQVSMATYHRCCYSQYGVSGAPTTVGTLSLDAGDAPRVECLIG